MADISGSYQSPYSSPYITTNISYSQTARTGSSVTYHFNVSCSIASGSSFGYSLGWSLVINGYSYSGTITGANYHTGPYTWSTSFDVNVPCGAGGGTLSATYNTTRPGGEGNSGKVTVNGTVNVSSYETAPYWSGGTCSIDQYYRGGWNTIASIIPEDADYLHIVWSGASDNEGNTRYYTVKRYVNGAYSTTVASNITDLSCQDYIGGGNQGYSYYYTIEVNDGTLWGTNSLTTGSITKNTFTPSSLSTSASIAWGTASITFSETGIKNSNGNGSFGYSLSCSQVTVFNPSASPATVTIWDGSGGAPATTYIKLADIKTATSANNYVGTFTFSLSSWNGYGSSGSANCNVSVNIQTAPVPVTTAVVTPSGYYTIGGSNYYVPNRKAIVATWNAYKDVLTGTSTGITYDVQVNINSAGFVTVVSGVTALTASFTLNAVTSKVPCIIRVVAKTSYGKTAYCDAGSINLDYYNPPNIVYGVTGRTASQATLNATVSANSSITGLTITSMTYKGISGSNTTVTSPVFGAWSVTESAGDSTSYTFSITVQDSAGAVIGTSANTQSITVAKYTPMFTVREKGVGVNMIPNGDAELQVGGSIRASGTISSAGFTGSGTGTSYINQWMKFATISITSQYADADFIMFINTHGSGSSINYSAHIDCRVKQQNAMGSAPNVQLRGHNYVGFSTSDFVAVTTVNTASLTEVQFFIRMTNSYDAPSFNPIHHWGSVTFHNNQPYVATLPTGTQTAHSFMGLSAGTIYENGTALSSKYLGISDKASDSNLLDGIDSSNFVYGSNNTGTISGSTDFNAIWKSGFYDLLNPSNAPSVQQWYWLLNIAHSGDYPGYNYGTQITGENNTNGYLWYRNRGPSGGGTWRRILYDGDNHTIGANMSIIDGNTKIGRGSANSMRVLTDSGYIDIGPQNTGWCHIYTDRSAFYFSTQVTVNGVFHFYDGGSYFSSQSNGSFNFVMANGNAWQLDAPSMALWKKVSGTWTRIAG